MLGHAEGVLQCRNSVAVISVVQKAYLAGEGLVLHLVGTVLDVLERDHEEEGEESHGYGTINDTYLKPPGLVLEVFLEAARIADLDHCDLR